ncbi:MAG: hypothetical protein JOY80_06205 [Candidatus Dormibacteraeota bacterium]|nr:hypothetical protein [Candidatus Dormibacteraeota bacterium]
MSIEHALREFERRIGIDRSGRSVWVWLVPMFVGVASGIFGAFMPGIPGDFPWPGRVVLGLFGLVTMTAIAVIYLISFDNDRNQSDEIPRSR